MNRRALAILVVLSSLACNFLTGMLEGSTPTPPPPTPIPATATPAIPTPAYIPAACQNQPLATVPAATALAEPTPFLLDNPDVPPELQLQVFDDVVSVIEDVYVYPDFNGVDWEGLKKTHREKIEAGVDTKTFYETVQALVAELNDDHSYLESPVEVAVSEAQLAGTDEFVGIGAFILPFEEKGHVTLIFAYPNSPAEHAGLKAHDSILAADGLPIIQDGEARIELVRGPECSAVVLTVQSPGEAPRQVMVVRERIQSPMVIQASLLPTSDGSRVGYIFLPTFFDQTIPDQVRNALENFGPLDGLILDNRLNGGGSSSVVEPLLSFFASGRLGSFTSRRESNPLTIEADPIHNSQTVPLVILVSEDTVSFGEIFSGVLRDAGRAKIVGEPTLGNVEILHGYEFDDGSILWIAEETFVPANSSENWEETGIVPDVIAHADWDTFTFENDPSIQAAVRLLGH
ncbi:MAG: hypothetical protein DPW18_04690 [Chloroflexi bacterium]|nr:hypothetical protein [Chloroflexota bacterium]MDL1942634.1 hypothetical protein [Chloroflexi bacterium CFX2]